MKKRFLAIIIVSSLLCFSLGINTAVAATCSGPHSQYENRVIEIGHWRTSHKVYTNLYDSNGNQIYVLCNYDAEAVKYNVVCGVCNEIISGPHDYIRTYNHSSSWCPNS